MIDEQSVTKANETRYDGDKNMRLLRLILQTRMDVSNTVNSNENSCQCPLHVGKSLSNGKRYDPSHLVHRKGIWTYLFVLLVSLLAMAVYKLLSPVVISFIEY